MAEGQEGLLNDPLFLRLREIRREVEAGRADPKTVERWEELRETVRNLPVDRLLVETDAPYLAPIPKRGKRNEPAFTAYTAAKVADLKGLSTEDFAAVSTANFHRLFSKVAA